MAVEQLATVDEVTAIWSGFANIPSPAQQSLINTASQKILNFLRRPGIAPATQNELKDGTNTSILWLDMRPVISITTVTVNGEVVDNGDGLAWVVDTKQGKLVRGSSLVLVSGFGDPRFQRWWPKGTQNILVQYQAGFTDTDAIKMGVAFYCQFLRNRLSASGVFSSESLGDYSYTLNATATKWGIPSNVLDLILDYVQDDGPL